MTGPDPTAAEIAELANVTALEAFCLATAAAMFLVAANPEAADVIARMADEMHQHILGVVADGQS